MIPCVLSPLTFKPSSELKHSREIKEDKCKHSSMEL
jgi:hypothetical protein